MKRSCLLFTCLAPSLVLWGAELPPGWTEGEDLSPAPYCRGGFLAAEVPALENQLRIRAEQVSREASLLQLRGNIEVVTNQLLLRGEEALYDEQDGLMEFIGAAQLTSPSLLAETDGIFYRSEEDELTLGATRFSLPELHAWGQADRLYRRHNLIELEEARFSFCDPQEESWHIRAKKLNLNLASMQGNARNVRLLTGKVPILYLPYLAFPLGSQRQSGLLYPYFAIDQTNGFTYSQPIYFNLAPQADTTSYLHLIQRRGFLMEQEFRWLTSLGEGELGFGYLPYDELQGEGRSASHLEFSSNLRRGWAGDIVFTELSDTGYAEDLPHFFPVTDDFALLRRVHIGYGASRLQWTFGLKGYQLLAEQRTPPYEQLPYTTFSYFSPLGGGFYFSDDAEYILFAAEADEGSPPFHYQGDNGRLHNTFSFGWEGYSGWGFLRSGWNLNSNHYRLSNQTTSYGLRNFYLDSGLEFSRFLAGGWCPCQFIFQPRLYGLWVNGDSQDELPAFDTSIISPGYDMLFSPTQFSGNDRFANADRVSLGLESYILNFQGEEIYRMRLGRAAYQDPPGILLRNETLATEDRSPWMMDLSWRLAEYGYLEWSLAHDEEQLVQQGLALKYGNKKDSGFTFSYYEDTNLNMVRRQLGSHFAWQLRPRWSLFGEAHYDIEGERTPLNLGGFGYENCCLRTFFGAYGLLRDGEGREERENGVVLQFFLKPLGGGQVGHNFLTSRIQHIYDSYQESY